MSLEPEDSHDELPGEGNEPNKKSERKRQREKQRRSDLSRAFDELSAYILQVEPDSGEVDVDMKKKRKRSGTDVGEDSGNITRLDLIGRALRIMKRLHRENEERKRVIEHMRERERGGRHHNSDNVLVMVPTLSPVDDPGPVARASYPPYYQHGSQLPPMPPHPPEYAMPLAGRGGPSPGYHHGNHWGNYGRSPHPPQGPPQHMPPPPGRSPGSQARQPPPHPPPDLRNRP